MAGIPMDDEQVQVLNFSAVLISKNADDKRRKFVISFYLFDQTMAIYEEQVPNSGFRAGKFLNKMRVKNPVTKEFFAPQDFYIGARLTVSGRVFELTGASELALGLMESNPDDFPESDITADLARFGQAVQASGKDLRGMFEDAAKNKRLLTDKARPIIEQFVPKITKHAAITITRGFDRDGWFAYEDLLKYLRL